MFRILAICLLALSQIACVSSRSMRFSTDDTLLGVEKRDDGSTVTWRLSVGRSGGPKVEKTVTETRELALLGVRSRSIGATRADRYGIDPWSGVWLDRVDTDLPAHDAGLRSGDVLMKIGDVAISSPDQMTEVVEQALVPGTSTTVTYMRFVGEEQTKEVRTAELTPQAKEVTESSTDSIALETSVAVQNLTGLRVAHLPADIASHALKLDSGTMLIAGVLPGSPAYMKGLRAGDRIIEVDGQPADSLGTLVAAVLARADEKGLSIATDERKGLPGPRAGDGPVGLRVEGPLGVLSTEIDISGRLSEEGEIDIPILFECDSDISSTRWSFLDFIFQFGANYRGYYLESQSRKPAKYTFFSMLPFGFFEVERQPGHSRYCIFWFIEWETGH
ncbi:PDZ domain-containing protein [Engelhardtia mirabilis]|uniref:Putative periplasmic serine endoprotease DegP-like n=1 Tax=Engelhardtia mirabilis TaxID=2528011 RepID=A0A518BG49_9BACT|nr:putative periplasmic serine endoprotease DegP-like precursor [Planctomycetes bacterium Pla133]QDV00288.1 putative periplasmic serine endoprotease DegP-like precursor [Planctomycetes bacterium Pla86]